MAYLYRSEEFNQRIKNVQFWAPVRVNGSGRFSDTGLFTYKTIQSVSEIVWNNKTELSARAAVFPINQTMLEFTGSAEGEARIPAQNISSLVIVLARACDIHAFNRLDAIFLENGHRDPYYQRRRERLAFLLLECAVPFDSCFCVSMRANRTDQYDAIARPHADGVEIQLHGDRLAEIFPEANGQSTRADRAPRFAEKDGTTVRIPDCTHDPEMPLPEGLLCHPFWQQYDARCIACGRCNTSCPTCSCFSIDDVRTESGTIERRRTWHGCHLDGFTTMAGGHSFREKHGARMRFKAYHKVYDFLRRFYLSSNPPQGPLCVGCGRCDDVCPEYISFSACLTQLTEASKTSMKSQAPAAGVKK